MAADAGAQQILDLLNQPSDQLRQDSIALRKAIKNARNQPYGVMQQYGIDAVTSLRAFYRDLRAQIDAIDTVDLASKTSALDACDAIDRCFGSYERSLELGYSDEAVPKAKKAAKRASQGLKSLRQARKGLSQ
jgi:hypothetical protein